MSARPSAPGNEVRNEKMMKAIIAAAAAAIAIAPTPLLAAFGGLLASGVILAAPAHADCDPDYAVTEANAACYCDQHQWPDGNSRQMCIQSELKELQMMHDVCRQQFGANADMHGGRCQTAQTKPPTQAPATTPAQGPTPTPVQAPVTKPALVAPPKGLAAPASAVEAARAALATHVDPANPPTPPTQVDFNQRAQSVITTHNANIDVVNGLAHPRHWDYIDYDADRHPVFYNPMSESMTFRYFYGGDYREVYVAAGSRVVLGVGVDGVFPFTAVGDDYLASGSFDGGSPPALYQDVAAYVPAYNQTVQVGKVQPVGHDDSQPAGSQDTFMLDDSTLAWGQATNPSDGGQITVTKTQTLPGVGPTDDGKSLVDLAAASHPQPTHTWWPWLVIGGVLVIAVGLVAWVATRRKGARI
jgi:hypothetical protein